MKTLPVVLTPLCCTQDWISVTVKTKLARSKRLRQYFRMVVWRDFNSDDPILREMAGKRRITAEIISFMTAVIKAVITSVKICVLSMIRSTRFWRIQILNSRRIYHFWKINQLESGLQYAIRLTVHSVNVLVFRYLLRIGHTSHDLIGPT